MLFISHLVFHLVSNLASHLVSHHNPGTYQLFPPNGSTVPLLAWLLVGLVGNVPSAKTGALLLPGSMVIVGGGRWVRMSVHRAWEEHWGHGGEIGRGWGRGGEGRGGGSLGILEPLRSLRSTTKTSCLRTHFLPSSHSFSSLYLFPCLFLSLTLPVVPRRLRASR